METDGIKFDDAKPDYSLLTPRALEEVVKVLTYGARKYAPHNWRKLERADDRYFAAAQRHLWATRRGEITDPESGMPHLAHAIASLLFSLELSLENTTHETE